MTYEMQIRGTREGVKVRNVWAVILLPIATLGVYHLVWWYRVNKELMAFGEANGQDLGQNPRNSLLAVFPGVLIVYPAIATYRNGVRRVQSAARIAGREPISGWIALFTFLLAGLALGGYLQLALNRVWGQEAEPRPGHKPPPARDEMSPRLASSERRDSEVGTA
ncbi:MAG TPA: DUF4234 domain-containing protein [Solirubrobacterales bacterium]|jgi:hypothetical protein|nr:DUF4234 domain-containing protein [Solirubrobacterales bacterium]